MKKTYIILAVIILALVGVDQLSKTLILNHNGGRETREICFDIQTDPAVTYSMYPGIDCDIQEIAVIPGLFHFTFSFNTGASFGSFKGNLTLFYVISVFAAVLFYFLLKDVSWKTKKWYTAAVVLMIAGGIGNFIDRLLFQKVTDFIELEFMRFAIFNFADMCLVVGVILFGIDLVLEEIHGKHKSTEGIEQPED
jgi:signal peptidase II